MNFISEKIIKFKGWIVAIFLILTIVMAVCALNVKINYNMQDYLPKDANSTKAIEVMTENFDDTIANANVLIKDVTIEEAKEYKSKLLEIDGVENITWLDSAMDDASLSKIVTKDGTLATEYLDDTTRQTLEGFYKDKNALFQVTIENGKEKDTVNSISDYVGDKGALNGSAVEQAASQNLAMNQTIMAISLIAPLIIIILILSTSSWIEPFIYLTTIGIAVIINLGICLLRGSISYVTLAVAPLLQLAVSLDYAVFLSNSFDKYRKKKYKPAEAMKLAMKDSLKSISASCLTTLFGFIALLFMNFLIGPDMGISLVVGVILSFISVLTLLPALILCTYKLNDKCKHRPFLPSFKGTSNILVKLRIPALIICLLLVVGAYTLQGENKYIYGSGEPSEESKLYKDNKIIEEIFGKNNTVAILVPVGNNETEEKLSNELEKLDYVTNVMSFAKTVGYDVPAEYLPPGTVEKFNSDKYARIILTTSLETEGEESFTAIEEIKNIVYTHYNEIDVYMCGNTVNMYDMKNTIEADNELVSLITLIAIFVILLVEFKSLIIPVLLILSVKGSIWITMALSAVTGKAICYIGYLVVSTVMMGATIDYAILITDNYIKERKNKHKINAMKSTLQSSIKSILVSASTLAIAGFALGLSSSESIVQLLGFMLGKGTLVAFVMSLTMLPGLLILFDKLISKLSLGIDFLSKDEKEIAESDYEEVNEEDKVTKVICINREYGSGGHEIASRVAKELNIKFLDKEVIMKASNKIGIDEDKLNKYDERLNNKLLYTSIYQGDDESYYGLSINDALYKEQQRIIKEEVKKNDCVIVGRCASEILKNNKNIKIINVFITAKEEDKIKRKMELLNISKEEAIKKINKYDKKRAQYYKYHTGKDWKDPANYLITMNFSYMGIDLIVELLEKSYNDM